MRVFLAGINRLFDLLFAPFRALDPMAGLAAASLATGVAMLLVFRFTSNQRKLKEAKERLKAHLLALWLFQDQLSVVFRTQGRMLRAALVYLRHSLRPLAILLLPLVLLLVQLEMRYGREPIRPGASFLLTAALSDPSVLGRVSLEFPDGLTRTAPTLRSPDAAEVVWRLTATRPGNFSLMVRVGEQAFPKEVVVGGELARLSPRRVRANWLDELLEPGEPALPADGPLQSIEVNYPARAVAVGSLQMHWLIPFLVLSLLAALLLKGVLRTEI